MDSTSLQAQTFAQKVRHYLITKTGKTAEKATVEEFYHAFCRSFHEEIMINMTATMNTFIKQTSRMLYYLSMEYMPGRLFGNNVTNVHALDLVKKVLHILGRDYEMLVKIEPDIGIGNGGLGRLASCFMDSLATLDYPALGYGMRYQYGIFDQELISGVQVERPDCWLLNQNPWEFRRDALAVPVCFGGKPIKRKNSHGEDVFDLLNYEGVRALPYDFPVIGYRKNANFSVLTLRLWSTKESPLNFQLQRYNAGKIGQASENTSLTDVLYPNDNHEAGKRIRLKQEFLFVSASLQDILRHYFMQHDTLDRFCDQVRIQINDTHPALLIPELVRILTTEHDIPFAKAWEMTKTCCSYTNHTVLAEALEEWNVERMKQLLPRQFYVIEKLHQKFCQEVRHKLPSLSQVDLLRTSIIKEGQICMANLAIYGSHKVNGVSELHTEILKKSLFKSLYELEPEKFENVTNGVTQRRWLLHCNPALSDFLTCRIGEGWITNFEEIEKIAQFASDPLAQKEFLQIKQANKERLLEMVCTDIKERHGAGEDFIQDCILSPDALYDVQIKRIHEYKRQLMKALHLLMIYQEIKKNPESHPIKRFVIFSGKAAPGYRLAKNIIRLIYCLARKINHDPELKELLKIVFVENYNVSRAEVIIPAADLSEQISTTGMEASGTGNIKFAINGALTICTDDGANVEMRKSVTDKWWPFLFGASADDILRMRAHRSYNPMDVYESHPMIKAAVDALSDGFLSENSAEAKAIESLKQTLLQDSPSVPADYFFVLHDLISYYETQKKVEKLYSHPEKWAEYAIHNMAGMGPFSADVSIENYAQKIWHLQKCPPDLEELSAVRQEYSQHDRCRVTPSSDPTF